ncbi:MAG: carbohydrate porin, partial [Ferrovum sp.]|nr:carbohydrate porin [Ferrovum sp.]
MSLYYTRRISFYAVVGVFLGWLASFAVQAAQLPMGLGSGEVLSDPPWVIQGDETFIDQGHGSFPSAGPNGRNSFLNTPENSYSNILGLNLGFDLGSNTEIWVRSETIRGIPLSNAGGLAALTNNDMQRFMENHFSTYLALGYVSQVVDLGGQADVVPMDAHQFERAVTTHRLSWTLGKVDVLALFDGNAYAHKADDQFLNWCFMASCAYDFAADARGYTWGADTELTWDRWSARFGWFAMPQLPNQLTMDTSMGHHFGVNGEIERRWDSGSLKLLMYQGRMRLANYNTYLNQTGVLIQSAPKTDAQRGGGGLNLQQALAPGVGMFARA